MADTTLESQQTAEAVDTNVERGEALEGLNAEQRFWRNACKAAASGAGPYDDLIKSASGFESHHILQNAAMKRYADLFKLKYNEDFAWAVSLFGGNWLKGSAHQMASAYQMRNRLSPTAKILEIMAQAKGALIAAGCSAKDAETLVQAAKDTMQLMNAGVILP